MFPKKGNRFPNGSNGIADELTYAVAIGRALRAELGGSHRAIKSIMAWTSANERTVKNWMAGSSGPRGDHLVDLIRHSDAVLGAVLRLAGRDDTVAVVDLTALRRRLIEMEADLGRLIEDGRVSTGTAPRPGK